MHLGIPKNVWWVLSFPMAMLILSLAFLISVYGWKLLQENAKKPELQSTALPPSGKLKIKYYDIDDPKC